MCRGAVALALGAWTGCAPDPALAAEPARTSRTPRDDYQLSLAAYEHHATRDDFRRPVFLFQHPLQELRAHELGVRAELGVHLLLGVWAEAVLPVVHKRVVVRYAPIAISRDETVPATYHELASTGLADPTLRLRYDAFRRDWFALRLGAGVRLPLDDNPESGALPARVPLGTGQREWFGEASLAASTAALGVELDYHFGYHPGDAASYPVRQVGSGQVASGVLGEHVRHRAALALVAFPSARYALELAPSFTVDENPSIVVGGRKYAALPERLRYEVALAVRLRARLTANHRLELSFERPFLGAHERDPFFPIVVPARGFGLTWKASGP